MVLNIIVLSLIVSIISIILSGVSIISSMVIIITSTMGTLSNANTWFSTPKQTRNPGHASHV